MKSLKLIIIIALMGFSVKAQEFKIKPNGSPSDITLEIGNLQAELIIEGHSGGEIIIEADGYDGDVPEKAKGLRPLSSVGVDNTEIGLNIEQTGTRISLSGTNRRSNDATYVINVPSQMNVKVNYTGWQSGDLEVIGISGELEIQSNTGDVALVDITGPVVLNTLSSDIEVEFKSISQVGPTSITSTSGDIDITIPGSSKGNFSLSSISGDVYTDLNFDLGDKEKKGLSMLSGTGTHADATLNGGGVEFNVNAISGDVFIRKGE